MESVVQINWAFSNKRQTAYATALADDDLDQSHPFEGADIADHSPNMSDNAAQFGKGHEFATRNELLSWDLKFRRAFQATTSMLGWAFAFHLGKVATAALGGSPAAYKHTMEYQDPNGAGYYGSGRQQPVTTIVEQVTSGLVRKFPSVQVQAVEVTGQLNDWVRLSVDLMGSGKKTDVVPVSGYTFPESGEGVLLRHASLTFTENSADISCSIRSFRFRSEMQYAEADGYCPGSGYLADNDPTSGQVRGKLEFTRRACLLEFVVNAAHDSALHAALAASTPMEAVLEIEGATVSGANSHKLTITVPKYKYRAAPIGADGDIMTYQVSTVIFYDATLANPFEVEVVNATATYLDEPGA